MNSKVSCGRVIIRSTVYTKKCLKEVEVYTNDSDSESESTEETEEDSESEEWDIKTNTSMHIVQQHRDTKQKMCFCKVDNSIRYQCYRCKTYIEVEFLKIRKDDKDNIYWTCSICK